MRKNRLQLVVVPLLAVMLTLVMGGCYSHVISVDGMGSDRYDTYEPNYIPDGEEGKSKSAKMVPSKVAKPR